MFEQQESCPGSGGISTVGMNDFESMNERSRQGTQRGLRGVVCFANQSCGAGRIVTRHDGPSRPLNKSVTLQFRNGMSQEFSDPSIASGKCCRDEPDTDTRFRPSRQHRARIDFKKSIPNGLDQTGGGVFDGQDGIRRFTGIQDVKRGLERVAREKQSIISQ